MVRIRGQPRDRPSSLAAAPVRQHGRDQTAPLSSLTERGGDYQPVGRVFVSASSVPVAPLPKNRYRKIRKVFAKYSLEGSAMPDATIDTRKTHSLTDFFRNSKVHIAQIKETRTPQALTVNGRAEVVILDTATYERMVEQLNQQQERKSPPPAPTWRSRSRTPRRRNPPPMRKSSAVRRR